MTIFKVSAVLFSLSLLFIVAVSNISFDAVYIQRAAVPIPGAIWLIASGLGFLGWFRRESSVD